MPLKKREGVIDRVLTRYQSADGKEVYHQRIENIRVKDGKGLFHGSWISLEKLDPDKRGGLNWQRTIIGTLS